MIQVRTARGREVPAMAAAAVQTALDQLVRRDRHVADHAAVGALIHQMYDVVLSRPGGAALVAEASGQQAPVGHVLLMPQANPFTGASELVIMDVYTAPAHRGRRVGRVLLEAAEGHARSTGCHGLVAQVALHNRQSLRLFQGSGFDSERLVVGKLLDPAENLGGRQAD